MKFKEYINSEIQNNEVEPSHDAFDRIQARLNNQPEQIVVQSSKKWWAIAATVIGLAVCTTVYFSMQDDQTIEIQMVKDVNDIDPKANENNEPKEVSNQEIEHKVEQNNESILANSNSKEVQSSNIDREEKEQIASNHSQELKTDQPQQKIEKPALATGFNQSNSGKDLATNLDTVKVKTKKKGNYVDPNMLLYSIENKESLKETNNQKTKVAVIDFNK